MDARGFSDETATIALARAEKAERERDESQEKQDILRNTIANQRKKLDDTEKKILDLRDERNNLARTLEEREG